MSAKADKQALKTPDVFISTTDHFFAWIERHARTVGVAAAVAILASVAWVSYGLWQSSRENAAADAIFQSSEDLKKAETKVREERAKKMQQTLGLGKDKAKNNEPVRPVDFAKDYQPAVDKVKAAIRTHANTKSAVVAAMTTVAFLMEQKQTAEALQVIELVKYQPARKDMLNGLWQMHKGLVLMENKKLSEAEVAFETILSVPELNAWYPEAQLKLGLTRELAGQPDKARAAYERTVKEFPQTDAAQTAQQFLRLMKLKSQAS